ncbi:hypothetical protein ASE63_22570 [Bosea sp. Root381]|nr:hypothetical protein ASE63_22570 [Bosea sp. Root381]
MPVSLGQWDAEMAHIREMEAKHPTYITVFSTGTDALRQARAVLALFAPVLAEKEREIHDLRMQMLADEGQAREAAATPVAFMAADELRAITQRELDSIPEEKGRRDRCKALYPIALYADRP